MGGDFRAVDTPGKRSKTHKDAGEAKGFEE
jgi:hypothetical protein